MSTAASDIQRALLLPGPGVGRRRLSGPRALNASTQSSEARRSDHERGSGSGPRRSPACRPRSTRHPPARLQAGSVYGRFRWLATLALTRRQYRALGGRRVVDRQRPVRGHESLGCAEGPEGKRPNPRRILKNLRIDEPRSGRQRYPPVGASEGVFDQTRIWPAGDRALA